MVHEFAVEPAALQKWESLRYFSDRFGMAQGRLISQYPKFWLRAVWDSCAEVTPLRRQQFEVTLERLRTKLIKTGRTYDEAVEWLPNAIHAHQAEPFRAILAATPCHASPILGADEVDDATALWAVPGGDKVQRTATAIATLVEPLLRMATTIRFIDQHFSGTAKHGRPLAAMLCHAFSGKTPELIEYHLNANADVTKFVEGLRKQQYHLNLPLSKSITFVRWRTIDGGENLHPRYILTNRGGLRIDYGLDEGREGETTDWNRLSETHLQERSAQFHKSATCFEFVDAWRFTSSAVEQIRDWNRT